MNRLKKLKKAIHKNSNFGISVGLDLSNAKAKRKISSNWSSFIEVADKNLSTSEFKKFKNNIASEFELQLTTTLVNEYNIPYEYVPHTAIKKLSKKIRSAKDIATIGKIIKQLEGNSDPNSEIPSIKREIDSIVTTAKLGRKKPKPTPIKNALKYLAVLAGGLVTGGFIMYLIKNNQIDKIKLKHKINLKDAESLGYSKGYIDGDDAGMAHGYGKGVRDAKNINWHSGYEQGQKDLELDLRRAGYEFNI